ncbi:MAG: hypothetical protein IKY03_00390 [Clostridia bacterium]|nr:hypothetical protein [Clostridia bacterium]
MRKFTKEWFLQSLKNIFTKNIGIKIVALLFAVMLWGYVLADLNPYRVKVLHEISVSFDGEAELMAKGLCVRGNREEMLKKVSASVRTQIKNYSSLSSNAVVASINLRNISEAAEYDLPVTANISSALGIIQQVTPSTVRVEIDSLVSKTVPVSCEFTGQVKDGYWADMDNLSSTARLDIQGPKTDISRISRAECQIDLTGRTSTIFGTFDLVLYDADNQVIDPSIVVGTVPSSTVRLPIYPIKEVPIDVESSLLGTDKLAANYELTSFATAPAYVRIVGSEAALREVESVTLEPFSISGAKESISYEATLIVPDDVELLDEPTVQVTLDITEKEDSLSFEQLPIQITGLGKDLTAKADPEVTGLTVSGRVSLLSILKRSDIKIDVDVTDLGPGTYELPVTVYVRNDDTTMEMTTIPTVQFVTVVIE